jgi:hypothetical protein
MRVETFSSSTISGSRGWESQARGTRRYSVKSTRNIGLVGGNPHYAEAEYCLQITNQMAASVNRSPAKCVNSTERHDGGCTVGSITRQIERHAQRLLAAECSQTSNSGSNLPPLSSETWLLASLQTD